VGVEVGVEDSADLEGEFGLFADGQDLSVDFWPELVGFWDHSGGGDGED